MELKGGEEQRLFEAISQNPHQVSSYRRLARLLQQRKKPREAASVVNLALKRGAADRDIKVLLARLYEEAGDRRRAIQAYKKLIREKPADFLPYERLERIYKETGKQAEIVKMFSAVSEDNPQKERALKRLVSLHKERGEWRAAIRCLKLLQKRSGPDFMRCKELGRLYQKSGSLTQAIHCYQEAKGLQPQDPETTLAIGICQRKAGKKDEARRTFEEVLRLNPGFYGGHIHLAEMKIEEGSFQEAESHLEKLEARWPGNSRVKINRAHILLQRGSAGEALELAREGWRETPFYYTDELSLGHTVLAGACQKLGHQEEADYHRLLADRVSGSSDFFRTLVDLIDELLNASDLKLAEKVADGLLDRFPGNSLASLKKAQIRRLRGDAEGALSLALRASRESNPRYLKDRISALEFLSQLYADRQDDARARESRQLALQLREKANS